MNIERFTTLSKQSISQALAMATSLQHSELTPLHLLSAMIADTSSPTRTIINLSGGDATRIAELTTSELNRRPTVTGTQPQTSPKSLQVLTTAIADAQSMGDSHATVEHLLLALVEVKSEAKEVLELGGVKKK
ncbi:MAG: Clp protease N-terminal domain-containing protein [Phycisphaerales bacterium]|jgi:ATP-dependent Clp protease ATP-binding subunit ClpB|nr:Clp protease N-terminal domain-containing protein [Phycisphaerales bacterium]